MKNFLTFNLYIALLLVVLISTGCYRGRPSERTPIHVNPNMDKQPKYTAQSRSDFFDNHSAMRQPVAGTVSRGSLHADTRYYEGKDSDGNVVKKAPVTFDMSLLKRGQERYGIYCAVCHGETGEGNGIVTQRGLLPPPSFHEQRLRDKGDGYLFDVITNGKGNMPSYKHQVPTADRWAVIGYIRALQRSQNATAKDLPEIERNRLR